MIVSQGPLTWPYESGCDLAPFNLSPDQQTLAIELATDWIWRLTGRRWGTREVVERPQTSASWSCLAMLPPYLVSIYGPQGWPFDTDPRTGSVSSRQIIELAVGAADVTGVSITDDNGVTTVLASANYRLEGRWLLRTDGNEWPQTQDSIANLGQPNTWSISYTRGDVPDAGGQYACGLLVCQFAKALAGDTTCELPYNTQTATRSGVTVALNTLMAGRTTGIKAVDQYVASTNPNGLMQPPRVWSPDVARNQRPYLGSHAGGF